MTQHISVRIPWHDSLWIGHVCKYPDRNQACRVLKNIAQKRNDINAPKCSDYAGYAVTTEDEFIPPCLTESGQFMSDHEMKSKRHHPYTYNKDYSHILGTILNIPSFSFVGIPYNWLLKDKKGRKYFPNSRYFTGYKPGDEKKLPMLIRGLQAEKTKSVY